MSRLQVGWLAIASTFAIATGIATAWVLASGSSDSFALTFSIGLALCGLGLSFWLFRATARESKAEEKIGPIEIKIGDKVLKVEPKDAESAEAFVDAWLQEARETDREDEAETADRPEVRERD